MPLLASAVETSDSLEGEEQLRILWVTDEF